MGGLGARSGPGFCRVIGAAPRTQILAGPGEETPFPGIRCVPQARFASVGLSCPPAESLLGPKSVRKREAPLCASAKKADGARNSDL